MSKTDVIDKINGSIIPNGVKAIDADVIRNTFLDVVSLVGDDGNGPIVVQMPDILNFLALWVHTGISKELIDKYVEDAMADGYEPTEEDWRYVNLLYQIVEDNKAAYQKLIQRAKDSKPAYVILDCSRAMEFLIEAWGVAQDVEIVFCTIARVEVSVEDGDIYIAIYEIGDREDCVFQHSDSEDSLITSGKKVEIILNEDGSMEFNAYGESEFNNHILFIPEGDYSLIADDQQRNKEMVNMILNDDYDYGTINPSHIKIAKRTQHQSTFAHYASTAISVDKTGDEWSCCFFDNYGLKRLKINITDGATTVEPITI